jgi:hypothetical protein
MFWMLLATLVVFGGVFAVKAFMNAGMNGSSTTCRSRRSR